MRIRVIAVGNRMPGWVDEAVATYTKRMPADLPIEWRTVKAEARTAGLSAAQCKAREAQRIRESLPGHGRCVLLDERGRDLDSQGLAHRLTSWRTDSVPVAIVIGGPDGIDDALKAQAHESLRLSSLTLPHALVRVLLAEQLYRAWSICSHHPYHRE